LNESGGKREREREGERELVNKVYVWGHKESLLSRDIGYSSTKDVASGRRIPQ